MERNGEWWVVNRMIWWEAWELLGFRGGDVMCWLMVLVYYNCSTTCIACSNAIYSLHRLTENPIPRGSRHCEYMIIPYYDMTSSNYYHGFQNMGGYIMENLSKFNKNFLCSSNNSQPPNQPQSIPIHSIFNQTLNHFTHSPSSHPHPILTSSQLFSPIHSNLISLYKP